MASAGDSGAGRSRRGASEQPASDVTRLLTEWQSGDLAAGDRLIRLIYPDLRRLAFRQLDGAAQVTLQPTALVHEVWLKLDGADRLGCESRAHFMSLVARIMRQIVIDHARHRSAGKRDGGVRITLHEQLRATNQQDLDVLALDQALYSLASIDADKARIVEMHYFGGMSSDEIAAVMGCSAITVKRGWRTAKAWLREQLE